MKIFIEKIVPMRKGIPGIHFGGVQIPSRQNKNIPIRTEFRGYACKSLFYATLQEIPLVPYLVGRVRLVLPAYFRD